jgi:hypothetical protein
MHNIAGGFDSDTNPEFIRSSGCVKRPTMSLEP